jgi:hypothetical protein
MENLLDDGTKPQEKGLRSNAKANASGAQTKRRGEAGPVQVQLRADTHRPLFSSHSISPSFDGQGGD